MPAVAKVLKIAEIIGAVVDGIDKAKDALVAAQPAICSAYRSNPGFFTNTPSPLIPGVGDALTGVMDSFCRNRPLPPPRSVPYQGGQCRCVEYRVGTSNRYSELSPVVNGSIILRGPFGLFTETAIDNNRPAVLVRARPSLCSGGVVTGLGGVASLGGYIEGGSFAITSVVRVDGQLDSCGNPPISDPPPSPSSNNDNGINITVNVPDLRVGANVVVPVVILRPEINLNPTFSFNPTFNATIPIRIGNETYDLSGDTITQRIYSPDIITTINSNTNNQFNSNTASINATINSQHTSTRNNINNNTSSLVTNSANNINSTTATNISSAVTTINSNTNASLTSSVNSVVSNSNSNTASLTNTINNSTNTINNNLAVGLAGLFAQFQAELNAQLTLKFGNINVDLGGINNTINLTWEKVSRELPCPPCPEYESPDDLEPEPIEPDEKNRNNARVRMVVIVITKEPVKAQWGGGAAPDKLIAGWFSWKLDGGSQMPLEQINYSRSAFVLPPGLPVRGYSYTLTNFSEGFAIEYSVPV